VIVELSRCRWTVQQIDPAHVFPAPDLVLSTGPIVVGPMNDGCWFVHNGRHRVMRALLAGQTHIEAVLLPV
jgi:hypothetical protein